MLRARDVIRIQMGDYTVPADPIQVTTRVRSSSGDSVDGQPHPPYTPWVARLQAPDPWRVTFAHDLAIWERGT